MQRDIISWTIKIANLGMMIGLIIVAVIPANAKIGVSVKIPDYPKAEAGATTLAVNRLGAEIPFLQFEKAADTACSSIRMTVNLERQQWTLRYSIYVSTTTCPIPNYTSGPIPIDPTKSVASSGWNYSTIPGAVENAIEKEINHDPNRNDGAIRGFRSLYTSLKEFQLGVSATLNDPTKRLLFVPWWLHGSQLQPGEFANDWFRVKFKEEQEVILVGQGSVSGLRILTKAIGYRGSFSQRPDDISNEHASLVKELNGKPVYFYEHKPTTDGHASGRRPGQ